MKIQDEAAPPAESVVPLSRSPHHDAVQSYRARLPEYLSPGNALAGERQPTESLLAAGGGAVGWANAPPKPPHPAWVRLIHHPGQSSLRLAEAADGEADGEVASFPESCQSRCSEEGTAQFHQDLGFYASVLDQLPYGVYCVDRQRTILYWNAAAAAITGFQRHEVEGACCAQNILRHVDDAGRSLCLNDCPLSATLLDGQVRRDRVYLHHRQGYRVPVWIQVVPWRDRQQNIIGAIETFVPEILEVSTDGQLLSQLDLDDLTQIGNRRFGRMHLEQLIERSPWHPYDACSGHHVCLGMEGAGPELGRSPLLPGGVLFLDIDHFKAVNDRYGHQVGDRVLIMVARTISNTLRHGDYVARWGGEEFIVLLNQTDAAGMQEAAERIRRLVASSGLDHEDHFLQVTISIGGTLLVPHDSVETALERADAQMYLSKQAGRDCTHIAELSSRRRPGS